MKVKAQGLLNAAKHVEETFGRDALGEILRDCSPAVRETFTSSIAINWHEALELCEFVEVAEKKVGSARGKLARDIGAAGARANMKGTLLRIAFYLGKPEFLMKRAAGLWRQFNDEGTMELLYMDAHVIRVEVRGVGVPRDTFCAIIHGWVQETAVALGIQRATARHSECRAKGDARCVYEVHGLVGEMPGASGTQPPPPTTPPTQAT